MKKIKILFYSHTIDFAGTWRSHERTLLNLDKNLFDTYVFYNPNQDNNRLDFLKSKMDNSKIIPFYASKTKTSRETGYAYTETNFSELVKKYDIDILHFARSGYYEWPFIERIVPIQIETNVFGSNDDSKFLDYSVPISNKMVSLRQKADEMVYYPIPKKIENDDNLRKELNISNNTLVFGRIGRKDNFHSIALESIVKLKELGYKFVYIIIGACQNVINFINKNNLTDCCIILNTTNDDNFIHKFNNTIDMFLHYRSDGESFGTAIAQSMMYGKPIISHFAGYNAQSEIISNGGFVCNDTNDYTDKIINLLNDKDKYNEVSENAKIRAMDFEESKIVKQWEKIYLKLYNNLK